jgi:hypothetical protein
MMANDSWDISILQVPEDTLHQNVDSNHAEVCKVVSRSTIPLDSHRNMKFYVPIAVLGGLGPFKICKQAAH